MTIETSEAPLWAARPPGSSTWPAAAKKDNGPAPREDWPVADAGRDGGIRTRDPLHPMQVRYQAALRPDKPASISEGRALALMQMPRILPGVFRHLCMHHLFFHIAKQGRAAVIAILWRKHAICLLNACDAALAQH